MASTCIHDSRVVCASSPDGCSRKSFLDQCDMYEYNCDYGTQYMTKVTRSCTSGYQETYILFCGTLLTPTQFTQIQSSMTKDPTSNGINKNTVNQVTQILSNNVTSKSHAYETDKNLSTVAVTVSTSTRTEPSVINISKESDANKNDNHQTIPVYCCDRPLTWETTTEITNNYEDITVKNNFDEYIQTENSTEYNFTDLYDRITIHENENNITFTTMNQRISDNVILDDTTLFENIETEGAPDKKETVDEYNRRTKITEVTNIYEDRPIINNLDEIKQTSSKKTLTEYYITDNLNDQTIIHENENNITFTTNNHQISDTFIINDTTLLKNTDPDEVPDKKLSGMEIVEQTSPVYCCNRPLTWETTTSVTKVIEDRKTENNNSDENQTEKTVIENYENNDDSMQKIADVTYITDGYTKDTSKNSTASATQPEKKLHFFSKQSNKCTNNCQRPLTWLTTTRRRKRF